MIAFKINDAYLELAPRTEVTLTVNTPIYTGGDPTNIEGTYTFPFTVPLSGRNKALLGHPQRVDTLSRVSKISGVVFYGDGLPVYIGDLYILSSTESTAKLSFVHNPLTSIKDTKLAEVVDGQIIDDDMVGYAKSTALDPDTKPVVFFPVVNYEWLPTEWRTAGSLDIWLSPNRQQNMYDVDAQQFVSDAYNIGACPFPKAEYIIRSIIAASGFHYIDKFFDRDEDTQHEMKNLCIYSNFSISNPGGSWSNVINIKDHVPDMDANEFLKRFCSVFFLGIFDNPFDNSMSLIPLKDVLSADPVADWTSKASPTYEVSKNEASTPHRYEYMVDEVDQLSGQMTDPKLPIVDTIATDEDLPLSDSGNLRHYYATHTNILLAQVLGERRVGYKYFLSIETDSGEQVYTMAMPPLYMLGVQHTEEQPYYNYMPHVAMEGQWSFRNDTTSESSVRTGPRLVFYRGMQPRADGKLYPMGSNHNRNYAGQQVGQYSLLLNGEHGIIQKWGAEVVNYMKNRRTIQRTINLNIKDILNFKKQYKYRIENMNYFVSKMVIKFSTDQPVNGVECTLESVI